MLELPSVTLCAVTSVNLAATIAAMRASQQQVAFGDAMLLTDARDTEVPRSIRQVPIRPLASAADYSDFLLTELASHVRTDHVLIVQWDGFVVDAGRWKPEFLNYDYIGAPWPQFSDDHDVGNGGFSLRTRRLLEACRDPQFTRAHPEDVAIGRLNRTLLEQRHGCRFAPADVAGHFAFERSHPTEPTFGFHGIFNIIPLFGADRFWHLYQSLDERGTAFAETGLLLRQLRGAPDGFRRRVSITGDWLRGLTRG